MSSVAHAAPACAPCRNTVNSSLSSWLLVFKTETNLVRLGYAEVPRHAEVPKALNVMSLRHANLALGRAARAVAKFKHIPTVLPAAAQRTSRGGREVASTGGLEVIGAPGRAVKALEAMLVQSALELWLLLCRGGDRRLLPRAVRFALRGVEVAGCLVAPLRNVDGA